MITSINSTCFNISSDFPRTSSVYGRELKLTRNNLKHVHSVLAYGFLDENWDSYGASCPSNTAIVKANYFIAKILSPRRLDVFYTAPTVDGDILVELKEETCNLEFIFTGEGEDRVVGTCGGELYMEHVLNETTLFSSLNWLYRQR